MSMDPCTKSPIFCFVTVLDANAKCPIYFFFLFFFFLQLPWKVDDVENAMPIDDVKMVFFND